VSVLSWPVSLDPVSLLAVSPRQGTGTLTGTHGGTQTEVLQLRAAAAGRRWATANPYPGMVSSLAVQRVSLVSCVQLLQRRDLAPASARIPSAVSRKE
jgi:hypothetical protein